MSIIKFARVLGVAALVTVAAWVPAQAQTVGLPGTTLIATGSDVFVKFVSSDAGYSSDVWFFVAVGNFGSESQFLFNNHDANASLLHPVLLSGLTPGQEVIFGIYVQNTDNTFYTGDGGRNPDGLVHARVWTEDGRTFIGFEDLVGGGDMDFNDIIFEVSGVQAVANPEPVTMVLLGSGLFGIGGAGLARRRRRNGELL